MGSLSRGQPHVAKCLVGMGSRWPGDSESPSELWDFLQAKRHAYSKLPHTGKKEGPFIIRIGTIPALSIQKEAALSSLTFKALIIHSLAYILAKLQASILLNESS